MKLTVFQSDKGDCLLLTSSDNAHNILVDGGMKDSFKTFVAPTLGALASAGKKLDLVYVSHIDQDHIAGVLQLLDDMVNWRVHEFQINNGNPNHPPPDVPQPPDILEIWHNAFHEMIGANAGEIENLLAASAAILSGSSEEEFVEIATEQRELATSIPEAIKVSRRVSAQQLDIPLNKPFGNKLAFVRTTQPPPPAIQIGSLNIFVIGPFEKDLDILRKRWDKWLAENKATLAAIQKQAQRDAERLGTSDILKLMDLQIAQASELGNRKEVSPPNLASLMLLVEEGDQKLLLTGDGHADDILKGLKFHKKLDDEERIHVDVLKVQHHGSEHNIDENFVSRVTADHYIFCGNGEHNNPDIRVLALIMNSRIGNGPFRSNNPLANGAYKLWFNSSEAATKKAAAKEHMKQVKEFVEDQQANSDERMTFAFLTDTQLSFNLNI